MNNPSPICQRHRHYSILQASQSWSRRIKFEKNNWSSGLKTIASIAKIQYTSDLRSVERRLQIPPRRDNGLAKDAEVRAQTAMRELAVIFIFLTVELEIIEK